MPTSSRTAPSSEGARSKRPERGALGEEGDNDRADECRERDNDGGVRDAQGLSGGGSCFPPRALFEPSAEQGELASSISADSDGVRAPASIRDRYA